MIKRFLEAALPEGLSNSYFSINTLNNQKLETQFFDSIQDIIDTVQMDPDKDTWFACGLRRAKLDHKRGGKEEVVSIYGLWVDIDIKSLYHKEQNLPTTLAEASKIYEEVPKPSMIVNSGHGIHVYWFFKELWIFDSNKEKEKAQTLVTGFQRTLRRKAESFGWKLDNTSDLARILRLPGTYNCKDSTNSKLVNIISENDLRYNPDDLETYVITKDLIQHNTLEATTRVASQEDYDSDFYLVKTRCEWISDCIKNQLVLSEPLWYAFTGIVSRCQNGSSQVHHYSENYPGYSKNETNRKIKHSLESAGPRTCQSIHHDLGSNKCTKCQWKGRVTSPISLGRITKFTQLTKAEETEEIKELKNIIQSNNVTDVISDSERMIRLAHVYKNNINAITVIGMSIKPKSDWDNFKRCLKYELKNIKKKEFNLEAVPSSLEPTVNDMITSAPPSVAHLSIPIGYSLDDNGVVKLAQTDTDVDVEACCCPIFIVGKRKLSNIDIGSNLVDVTWRENNQWNKITTTASSVRVIRKIESMRDSGIPVGSLNAKPLAEFMQKLEEVNTDKLPIITTSTQFGHQEDGFLLGNEYITADSITISNPDDDPSLWVPGSMYFMGRDVGDVQQIDKFSKKGDLETCLKVVNSLQKYPMSLAAVIASIGTPVLEVINCPNYTFEHAGRTSSGKSATMILASSIFGDPFGGIISTWDITKVNYERVSAIRNDLPVFLDESQRRKDDPKFITDMIYAVSGGTTKGRGTILGIAKSENYRQVMFTTGERPCHECSNKSSGVRARMLSISSPPFGIDSKETRKFLDTTMKIVANNYGLLGRDFIKKLYGVEKQWPALIDQWEKIQAQLQAYGEAQLGKQDKQNAGVLGRICKYCAHITITQGICKHFFGDKWPDFDVISSGFLKNAIQVTKDHTGCIEALETVFSWAAVHQNRFTDRATISNNGTILTPHNGWAGRWPQKKDWEWLSISPGIIKNLLESGDYVYKSIITEWKERGWLKTTKNATTGVVKINGISSRHIIIRRKAIELILNVEQDEDPSTMF